MGKIPGTGAGQIGAGPLSVDIKSRRDVVVVGIVPVLPPFTSITGIQKIRLEGFRPCSLAPGRR
jgi:hypothetical protein